MGGKGQPSDQKVTRRSLEGELKLNLDSMLLRRTITRASSNLLRIIQCNLSMRVRYAPSPTGLMHIGGLRTALFNYLLAKSQGGSFIVRIEDTDRNREVQGSVDDIFRTLEWVGVIPDQSPRHGGQHGPYIQSQRLEHYTAIEKQLLKGSMAFPCFCLETQTEGRPYDGKCRELSLEEIKCKIKNKEAYAIRIKSDLLPLPASFTDEVFGELEFKPLDDFVIVRRNGWPTFHFANVIDDWKMEVTHVMRGQEWLTNTNKHIYLYKLLGAPVPKFIHLPLIKAMNGKKLAKRDPQSSVQTVRDHSYELEAVQSFLFGLGLNRTSKQGEEEDEQVQEPSQKGKGKKQEQKKGESLKLVSFGSMINKFSVENISRVPVKFDKKQLDHLNKLAIKQRWQNAKLLQSEDQGQEGQLSTSMQYFLDKLNTFIPASSGYSQTYCISMLEAVVERLALISDLSNYSYYFQAPDFSTEESMKDARKLFGTQAKLITAESSEFTLRRGEEGSLQKSRKIVHNLRMLLEHVLPPIEYGETQIAKHMSEFLYQSPSLRNEDVFHLLRFMVTGRRSGPNITLACAIIGREEVLRRLACFSGL